MPFPENPFRSDFAKGVALGLVAAAAVPLLLPLATTLRRPLVRAATRAGLVVYERTRDTLAELGEVADDFAAEARADLGLGDQTVHEGEDSDSGIDAEADEEAPSAEESSEPATTARRSVG